MPINNDILDSEIDYIQDGELATEGVLNRPTVELKEAVNLRLQDLDTIENFPSYSPVLDIDFRNSKSDYSDIITHTRATGGTRGSSQGSIVGVDFSSSSVSFGLGIKTFTLLADLGSNRDWKRGDRVIMVSQSGIISNMEGTVRSYDRSTQELTVDISFSGGESGVSTDWRIGSLDLREDHDLGTLQPKGILVEGGATNLISQSTDFSNGYWTKSANVVFEHGLPFFGTNWATKVTPTESKINGIGFIDRIAVVTDFSVTRHNKIFVKSNGLRYFALSQLSSWGGNPTICAVFDLVDGVIDDPTITFDFTQMTKLADGWWEVGFQSSWITNGYNQFRTGASSDGSVEGVVNFVGNGVDGFLIAQPHAENAEFRSFKQQSVIPTRGVAVTRASDLPQMIGRPFTDVYSGKGTLVTEFIPNSSLESTVALSVNDGTAGNAIRFGVKQSGTRSSIRAIATDGVTDVMALNDSEQPILRSNGVDYELTAIPANSSSLAVASDSTSKFLVGGVSQRIYSSSDAGLTTVERSIGITLNGAHFGIGRFVIAGVPINGVGSVIVSTDGLAFRRINIAGLTQNLNEVTSNGTNQYVAVGGGGVIYTSPDAEVWTAQVSGAGTAAFAGVHYFGGRYVAVTSNANNSSRYSDDGITWTLVTGLTGTGFDVYHNGTDLWVAVGGGGNIYSSPDGITWTIRKAGGQNLLGVHFADNLWVAVGNNGAVFTSPDGITWTDRTVTSGTVSTINEVGFFDGKFYAVLQASASLITATAAQATTTGFTLVNKGLGSQSSNGIATNGTLLLISGTSGYISTSDDGTTFTSRTGNNNQLNGVAFGNGTYVVVGAEANNSGVIATVDPVTFAYQRRESGTTQSIQNVRYLNGVFYAPRSNFGVVRSVDGVAWTDIQLLGTGAAALDIAFGNDVYVLVGGAGRVATSSDGITWSGGSLNNAAAQDLRSIYFANGLFVAVGINGNIITSTTGNANDWTLRTSGTAESLFAVHYSIRDQQWYAAGNTGTILRSSDAITWSPITDDAVGVILNNNVPEYCLSTINLLPSTENSIALSFSDSNVNFSTNGSESAVSSNPATIPQVDRITFGVNPDGTRPLNGHITSIRYYRLPENARKTKYLSS